MGFFCLHVGFFVIVLTRVQGMAFVSWPVILCQCAWYKLFDPGGLPNASQDLECMNKHFSFS